MSNIGPGPDIPWRTCEGGVEIHVRLTPRGGRDAIESVEKLGDGACVLKARVRAAPHDGEANDALARLFAKSLGRPMRDVTLTAGAASRIKTLRVTGDGAELTARLQALTQV